MNRQERRKRDRERAKEVKEIETDFDVLKNLNSKQLASINRILNKSVEISKKELMDSLDKNLTAALIEDGFTIKQIRELQDRVYLLSEEDEIKIKKLEKENIDMAKLQAEVREFMEGLIKSGKGRKEVVEETMFKFSKLSKTSANNAFGKIQEELEIEDAAAYILEDNKGLKAVVEKEEAKKIAKEVAENLEKEIEKEVKEEKEVSKEKGLEIIEEVVVKTVKAKGINGMYEAKTGVGVALENEGYKIAFKNVNELEAFCNEFKKMFGEI